MRLGSEFELRLELAATLLLRYRLRLLERMARAFKRSATFFIVVPEPNFSDPTSP